MEKHMERTQVYLPRALKKKLRQQARLANTNVSELLRQAATVYIDARERRQRKSKAEFLKALDRVAGMWADRDPKEFEEIRRNQDRTFEKWGLTE